MPEMKKRKRTVSVARRDAFIVLSLEADKKTGRGGGPFSTTLQQSRLAAAGRQVLGKDLRTARGRAIPRRDRRAGASAALACGLQRVRHVRAKLAPETTGRIDQDGVFAVERGRHGVRPAPLPTPPPPLLLPPAPLPLPLPP